VGTERRLARDAARQSDEILMTVRKLTLVNGDRATSSPP
jgi:hypothetical protein